MKEAIVLNSVVSVVWVVIGVLISLVLPVAVKALQAAKLERLQKQKPNVGQLLVSAWKKYGGNKYLGIVLAATCVAIVVVFLLGLKFFLARDAALAGFAWESLINKLLSKSKELST